MAAAASSAVAEAEEEANSFTSPLMALKRPSFKSSVREPSPLRFPPEAPKSCLRAAPAAPPEPSDTDEEPANSFDNPLRTLKRSGTLQKRNSPLVVPAEDPDLSEGEEEEEEEEAGEGSRDQSTVCSPGSAAGGGAEAGVAV